MKKGFTLVELLAVIVILAIILAIAVPTIATLIEKSKKSMFENSAKIVLRTMKNDYDGIVATQGFFTDTFILYDGGTRTVYPSSNNLEFTLSATDGGIVRHSDGTVTFAIYDGTNCAVKVRNSNDITVSAMEKTQCISNVIYKQAAAPFTNLVINGDFKNGTTGWGAINSTLSVSSNSLSLTGTGTADFIRARSDLLAPYPNKTMYIKANMLTESELTTKLRVFLRDGSVNVYGLFEQTSPRINTWYNISGITGILTTTSYNAFINVDHYCIDAPTAIGKTARVKDIIAVDLTSTYGTGNEPTKEQMDNNVNKVWIDTTNANTPKKFGGGGWVNF